MSIPIRFEPLFEDVAPPTRATQHSAGYDLHVYLKGREVTVRTTNGQIERRFAGDGAQSEVTLAPGEIVLLPLGFKALLPPGYEAQIRMRSSWAFKKALSLPNAPGTIDADYPDEWMVMMMVSGESPVTIVHKDRVAQAVLSRYEEVPWAHADVDRVSDRGGGFGSTG